MLNLITENLSTLTINKLTKEQYDRELAAGRIDENALYLTPDEEIDLSSYATKEYVTQYVANVTHDIPYMQDDISTIINDVADIKQNYATKEYVDSRIVVSSSEPANPVEGMIWIVPLV